MKLTYKPEDGDPQSWEVKLGRLRTLETEAIEKATGMAYGSEFKEALLKGNTRARRALLWTLLRRQHPAVKLVDVDFADDELVLEMDAEELTDTIAEVRSAPGLDDDQRAQALAILEHQLAAAGGPPAGKARARRAGAATPAH
jgi:hypothetical protein